MPVLVLQHNADSPPGLIGEELQRAQVPYELLAAYKPIRLLPRHLRCDGLVLLGGEASACDDLRCPHFPALLELIRDLAARDRPVLGVCLGAQLVARAFGAAILPRAASEFGFVPVELTRQARSDPLLQNLPSPVRLMQWHDDSFELPEGATHLMTGTTCAAQGFRIGRHVYGFQPHFEVTAEILLPWLDLYERTHADPSPANMVGRGLDAVLPQAMRFGRALVRRWIRLLAGTGAHHS